MRCFLFSLLFFTAIAALPALGDKGADCACCPPGSMAVCCSCEAQGFASKEEYLNSLKSGQEAAPGDKSGSGNSAGDALGKALKQAQEAAKKKAAGSQNSKSQNQSQNAGRYKNESTSASGAENQLAQDVANSILDDGGSPGSVQARVARLQDGGEQAFYGGVVQVATGIVQVSEAAQDREEHGESPDNTEVQEAGYQNIAQGTQNIESGRAAVSQGNSVAGSENRRTSVGASTPLPLKNLSFDRGRATPEANRKLDEMEEKTGVPAASLIAAVNAGGGREEIVSLAGGAKGVNPSGLYAAIPDYGTSSAPPSGGTSGGGSGGVAMWNRTAAPSASLVSVAGERKAAPPSERRTASAAPAAPRKSVEVEPEPLQSLGADNLLSALGAKEPEGTLFERVSSQYAKRSGDLLRR